MYSGRDGLRELASQAEMKHERNDSLQKPRMPDFGVCSVVRSASKFINEINIYQIMQKSMSKIFHYEGYKFNIKIELNYSSERSINGKTYHRITMSDMGASNWFQTKDVITKDIVYTLNDFQIAAEDFVDNRDSRTVEEKMLSDMGFK